MDFWTSGFIWQRKCHWCSVKRTFLDELIACNYILNFLVIRSIIIVDQRNYNQIICIQIVQNIMDLRSLTRNKYLSFLNKVSIKLLLDIAMKHFLNDLSKIRFGSNIGIKGLLLYVETLRSFDFSFICCFLYI